MHTRFKHSSRIGQHAGCTTGLPPSLMLTTLLLTALLIPAPVRAEENSDSEPPACRYCPDESGTSGWVEGGAGYQNNDDYRFGRYTGTEEEGVLFNAGGEFRYRGENGEYAEGAAQDLGLESRRIELEGGRQGRYSIGIEYHEIPNFRERSAYSPYLDRNDGRYELPANWVSGPTTTDMPNLTTDLRRIPLETQRDRTSARFSLLPAKRWEVSGFARHEKKDGTKDLGATFGFNQTVYLPVAFEYETDELGINLGYTGERFQAEIGYSGSFFNNDQDDIVWRNPYQEATSDTAYGRMAEAPDNEFHQLSGLFAYQLTPTTRVSARLARGRMTQDQDYLPYTINPSIATSALPANSLDGKVDTTLAAVELNARPLPRLRIDASHTYSDRDNGSSVHVYDYVVTDTASGGQRQNRPYSYTQELTRLKAAYRFPHRITLSGGYDLDRMERTYVQAEETKDKTLWSKLKLQPLDLLETTLKYSYSDRDVSSYVPLSQIDPLLDNPNPNYYDNPLMRVLTMTDRQRDSFGVMLSMTPYETLTLGFDLDFVKDDYDHSYLGLQEAKGLVSTLSLSYTFDENLSASTYYTYDELSSDQKGSEKLFYSDPDNLWIASSQNRTDTVGIGLDWTAIPDKLVLGADYTYSEFSGEIGFDNAPSLPDLTSRLSAFNLHGSYRISEQLSLRAEYRYERFAETDWTKDGTVNTLPTLLSLGTAPQDNTTYLGFVALRYEFQ
ncbi:MAG: MtrB/PioB family decaheme-associated outer membrane protein [Candidatus Thiodiazotropha sp.]